MYMIRGLEKIDGQPDHAWYAYAKSFASAKHLEKLFKMAGYEKILMRNLEEIDHL